MPTPSPRGRGTEGEGILADVPAGVAVHSPHQPTATGTRLITFADISLSDIKTDCRFYTGYKPCHKNDGCPGCTHYAVRGEQILIIKLGAMGDVLRTKAILPALKREHPHSWIVWITDPGSEVLVRDPLVDEVLSFTPAGVMALEGRRFARLLCLDKDKHAVALSARLDAARKQGFAPTAYNTVTVWNEASMYALRLGLSDPLKYRQNEKTVPAIVSEMCELPYDGVDYTLTLSDGARSAANGRWQQIFKGAAGRRVVGLNTGCGPVFATKGWTAANMKEFLQLASGREDLAVLLLGGPRERELHRELMLSAGDGAGRWLFDAGNDNPLETFFGIVEKCDAVLSADSLGMHVAIALKVPVIAWFGPTCEQEVDLFGRGEKIVTDFPCSPCYLKICPKPVTCMEAMEARTVFAALGRLLPARPR